jgi:hypothetical protein
MRKLLMTAAVVLATLSPALAQVDLSPEWRDVLQTCSAEYRERANKADKDWRSFLDECKTRKGFIPKDQRTRRADFKRVPDKQ